MEAVDEFVTPDEAAELLDVTPDRIEEGIARLGRAIKRRLARAGEAAGEVAVSP